MTTRKLYIWLQVLNSVMLAWTMTTYTLFVLSSGLTFTELSLLNTAFMFTNVCVDPWTGWLGDKYGHKLAFSAGVIMDAVAMLIYGFSQSFGGMLGAEVVAGFGRAFVSEAAEAWLENNTSHEEATQIMAVAATRSKLAGIVSAVLGAAVGSISLAAPWFLSAFSVLPILFLLWKYPWTENLSETIQKEKISYSLTEAKLVWNNRYLRNAVVVSTFVAFLCQPLNMYWNAKFEPEIGQFGLGLLWVFAASAMAIGTRYAGRYPEVNNRLIGVTFIAIAASVVLATSQLAFLALLGFVLHEAPRSFLGPLVRSYVRADTPAHLRAYFGSIRSALTMLAAAIGLMVFGPLADGFGITFTWQFVSVAFALGGIIFIFKK